MGSDMAGDCPSSSGRVPRSATVRNEGRGPRYPRNITYTLQIISALFGSIDAVTKRAPSEFLPSTPTTASATLRQRARIRTPRPAMISARLSASMPETQIFKVRAPLPTPLLVRLTPWPIAQATYSGVPVYEM